MQTAANQLMPFKTAVGRRSSSVVIAGVVAAATAASAVVVTVVIMLLLIHDDDAEKNVNPRKEEKGKSKEELPVPVELTCCWCCRVFKCVNLVVGK